MTGSPYDASLSALRDSTEDLATALFIWEDRDDAKPDAMARRKASEAVDAIDEMLRTLHPVRERLIGEIRVADDASAARIDALLEVARRARETEG